MEKQELEQLKYNMVGIYGTHHMSTFQILTPKKVTNPAFPEFSVLQIRKPVERGRFFHSEVSEDLNLLTVRFKSIAVR